MNRVFLIALMGLCGASSALFAQTTSSTPPIGFIRKDCPANSDTRLSIPLERQAEYVGPLAAITGNVLTVEGTPGWSPNQFQYAEGTQNEKYYVLFLSGTRLGRDFDVSANGDNTLTLDLGNDTLEGVVAGDRIKLLPHWTLDAAFPDGEGVQASSIFQQETELLVQDGSTAGINLAPVKTYFYTDSWKDFNNVGGDAGSEVIRPHEPLLVRNRSNATSAIFVGVVPTNTLSVPLRIPAGNGQQDNFVALSRPVPVRLRDAGLEDSFAVSPSTFLLTDQLLVYDDTQIVINKSPRYTYYRDAQGTWRRFGEGSDYDAGDEEIFTPGTGVIIRKAGTGNAEEARVIWTHTDPTQ